MTQQGKIVAFFGAKGGVGTSSLCLNTGLALSRGQSRRVIVVDASFPMGTLDLMVDVKPTRSWLDVVQAFGSLDDAALEAALVEAYDMGFLLAPDSPEAAETVTAEHVATVLGRLRARCDYVLVDTQSWFSARSVKVFGLADVVLVVANPELPTVRNAQHFLRALRRLGLPEERVQLVVNRADTGFGVSREDIERLIGMQALGAVPSDGRAVTTAANVGIPYLVEEPDRPVSRETEALARAVAALAQAREGT